MSEPTEQELADTAAQIAAAEEASAGQTRDPKPRRRPAKAGSKRNRKKEPSGSEKERKRRERENAESVSRETPRPPVSVKALERGLARTLTMPALPAAILPLPLDSKMFMIGHFTQAGPATAKQLAAAAEESPELRELLERANKGSATLTLLIAGCIYLAPVVLWVTGQREIAAMASTLASADPAELAAQAEAVQEQMAEAMMAAANGNSTEQQGAESPEHQGPAGSEAEADQAPAS